MDLLTALLQGRGEPAPVRPTQPPLDLARLLAQHPPTAAPAPAPPALTLDQLLRSRPAAPAADVRKLAFERMAAAGQFIPAAPSAAPLAPASMPSDLFRAIAKAGPKPKKPRAEAPVVSSLEAPAGGVSADDLLKKLGVDPESFAKNSRFAQARRRAGVAESSEIRRIRVLPRRPMDLAAFPDLTEELRRPGGTMQLKPVQNWALHECRLANGLLGPVGTGHGKTLISLLAAVVMQSKRAVLLVPPQLRAKTLQIDIPALYKHWLIPTSIIRVIAYSELSNARCAQILEELRPDLIVADECHNLRHKTAARTKRFLRYMKEHPDCRFVGLSGTITSKSIKDYQHLAELALRKNSPLPTHWGELTEWAEALDVSDDPMPPGALLCFCTPEEIAQLEGRSVVESQPIVRAGFRRRLVETPGVVSTEEGAIGTSLVISGLRPLVPVEVQRALDDLRKKWEIDGDELIDAMSVSRVARQLAGGFFYKWVWPNGIKDEEWLQARSAWNKELREILKLNRRGLDSPLEVINAIRAGKLRSQNWEAWAKVKDRPEPPREAVWISDYLVDEAIHWAQETCSKASPGILWYSWDALGQRLAQKGGFPWYGPGEDPSFAKPDKEPVIVCSVAAHGTGKNLQAYRHNLVTIPMSSGVAWEQAIARTHRPGQEADEVTVAVYLHTQEMQRAFDAAIENARYIEQTQGQQQKLLYAERLDCEYATPCY